MQKFLRAERESRELVGKVKNRRSWD